MTAALKIESRHVLAPNYTRGNFVPDSFEKLVNGMAVKIRALIVKHPEIEALAACGQSGLMLMGALSYVLRLPQIAVRKDGERSHSDSQVSGYMGCAGYLIIDDLVSSGNTLKSIIAKVHDRWGTGLGVIAPAPKPVAVLLYNDIQHNNRTTTLSLHGCRGVPGSKQCQQGFDSELRLRIYTLQAPDEAI